MLKPIQKRGLGIYLLYTVFLITLRFNKLYGCIVVKKPHEIPELLRVYSIKQHQKSLTELLWLHDEGKSHIQLHKAISNVYIM